VVDPSQRRVAPEPPPWVPLLRRLTDISPLWGVWKNADAAISGQGDIDSASPSEDRALILGEFRVWADGHGYEPIFVCRHLPGSVVSVALRGERELIELQLCERATYRGCTLFAAKDLASLMSVDRRGFRRLREGSEALLLLFYNGVRWGGRPAVEAIERKGLADMMRRDLEGMEAATSLFGSQRAAALRLGRAVLDGQWDRRAALAVETWALARGPREPHLWLSRATYRLRGRRYCPLLPVLRSGRHISGHVGRWLEQAEQAH
jgi:hypothetical protein